ncbi:MAG: hypothetical protein N3E51_02940 [Candidatus Micrarchaeota archaeon]|nr:hypothetical protein [Candidatus Micrarchaeota archaeon]
MAVSGKIGQTSLEFLYTASFIVLLFSVMLLLYLQAQQEQESLSRAAEARLVCHRIAAQLSAIATAGDGAKAELVLPPSVGGRAYSAHVAADNRSITVSYEGGAEGCGSFTSNIESGGSKKFQISQRATISNIGGKVVVE